MRVKPNIFKGSSSEEAELQRVRDGFEGLDLGNGSHEARRERLDIYINTTQGNLLL